MQQDDEKNSNQNPAPWAVAPQPTHTASSSWRDPKILAPLAVLLVILAVVVFWLPRQITVTPSASTTASQTETVTSAGPSSNGPLESPWTEAQLAKERREAQDILATVLDRQRELEAAAVNRWAEEDYKTALTTAAEGDELYRNREFEAAKQAYRSTADQFEALLERVDAEFQQAFEDGVSAIEDADAAQALASLDLALAIKPNNDDAASALRRAETLTELLGIVTQAQQMRELGQLDQAKSKLMTAKALDPQSSLVKEQTALLDDLILQRDFAEKMSAGYQAMSSSAYDRAIAAFEAALRVKPGAADAQSALTQAKNSATQTTIQGTIAGAKNAADQEQWAQALAGFQQALSIDENLVSAKVGSIEAKTRLDLDTALEKLLADPLSLSDPAVYQNAVSQLANAKSINDPGPRLNNQITLLEANLQLAQTPRKVTLKSDNQTFVTLYRVGQLGNFEQHQVELKPGQYVVVGSRAGYRDVRKEFVVQTQGEPTVVEIMCEEKIASS